MVQKIQHGNVINMTVHDEPKTATIQFFPRNGDAPLFVLTELKLTNDNESAYDAMVESASLGIQRNSLGGDQVSVRYDSGNAELDEITVR